MSASFYARAARLQRDDPRGSRQWRAKNEGPCIIFPYSGLAFVDTNLMAKRVPTTETTTRSPVLRRLTIAMIEPASTGAG